MTHTERIPPYLYHLIVACNRIAISVAGKTKDVFLAEVSAQDAVLRQIEVLGEVAKRIRENDEAFFERPDMANLYRIIGMRNRIAHEYLNVDSELVWQVASVEAPMLRATILRILQATNFRFDPDALHF